MRDASFHLFDRAAWPRSEHFDYYIRTVKCRYDLTAHLTVTALRERGKALGLRFYPLLLYIAARAINANREFRMGFNEHGAPGYWDFINPSYTIISMTTIKRFRTSGASTTNRFPFSTKTSCTTWKPTKMSKASGPNQAGRPTAVPCPRCRG